jgi:hypothetical protein
MPQKRNPISCAYIHACAAMVRQHAAALLDAMAADHERSTGRWEIEWIALPEIFRLATRRRSTISGDGWCAFAGEPGGSAASGHRGSSPWPVGAASR